MFQSRSTVCYGFPVMIIVSRYLVTVSLVFLSWLTCDISAITAAILQLSCHVCPLKAVLKLWKLQKFRNNARSRSDIFPRDQVNFFFFALSVVPGMNPLSEMKFFAFVTCCFLHLMSPFCLYFSRGLPIFSLSFK